MKKGKLLEPIDVLSEPADIIGVSIRKGSLVARSCINKALNISLVSNVVRTMKGGRVYFFGVKYKYLYQIDKNAPPDKRYTVAETTINEYSEYTTLLPEECQQHLVVITQPLFALDNKRIAKVLQIVDMAKDAGFLPHDYVFGTPL